ncbi:hypothetical protein [Lacticaseibacillus rhamnosus]|uniref:hypothetical protein n=1 Tax=Lacticaseibacillus rhamnosus TaxID=47715 RepID=UPI00237F52DD|nr:hypothetical protein [Lacticaseibacillus rhamnosus]MDE3295719.1 hypothetical protein [Lacticaseibacillus rhamnosus]
MSIQYHWDSGKYNESLLKIAMHLGRQPLDTISNALPAIFMLDADERFLIYNRYLAAEPLSATETRASLNTSNGRYYSLLERSLIKLKGNLP